VVFFFFCFMIISGVVGSVSRTGGTTPSIITWNVKHKGLEVFHGFVRTWSSFRPILLQQVGCDEWRNFITAIPRGNEVEILLLIHRAVLLYMKNTATFYRKFLKKGVIPLLFTATFFGIQKYRYLLPHDFFEICRPLVSIRHFGRRSGSSDVDFLCGPMWQRCRGYFVLSLPRRWRPAHGDNSSTKSPNSADVNWSHRREGKRAHAARL
jgi:hypothetical protein